MDYSARAQQLTSTGTTLVEKGPLYARKLWIPDWSRTGPARATNRYFLLMSDISLTSPAEGGCINSMCMRVSFPT